MSTNRTLVTAADDRYMRHRAIPWWDQDRLTNARVLVAGAGAIGNEVIKLLALMGVNNLTIVDFDTIEITNLTRSILFRDTDIGNSKSIIAAARARDLNPDSVAIGIHGDLEYDVGIGVYRNHDLIIGCLDSVNARLALNRCSMRSGTPWINGGIEATFGEVTWHTNNSACFECGMTESMWERRNRRYSCGGQLANIPTDSVPTTATIASIIASYLVNEALLLLHAESFEDKAGLKAGEKLFLSLQPYAFHIAAMETNTSCTAHEKWEPLQALNLDVTSSTVQDLLSETSGPDGILELGFDLLTGMHCVQCGETEEMLSPIEKSLLSTTHCDRCNLDTRTPVAISWIDWNSPLAVRALCELRIPPLHVISIIADNTRTYFQLGL